MGMFVTRKPRRFQHPYIYVDERKERLQALEENARRELGLAAPESTPSPEQVRYKLLEQTREWHRGRQRVHQPARNRVLLLAILALIGLLYVCLNGLV